MNKITLFENEYVKLWYHPVPKIVHHEISKSPPSDVFRKMLTKGAECLELHDAMKWLSDDSKNVLIGQEDNKWGDTVWAPRMIKAGFKFWAIVLPKRAIGQLQMQRFCKEYRNRGVTVELFEKVEAALKWLTSAG